VSVSDPKNRRRRPHIPRWAIYTVHTYHRPDDLKGTGGGVEVAQWWQNAVPVERRCTIEYILAIIDLSTCWGWIVGTAGKNDKETFAGSFGSLFLSKRGSVVCCLWVRLQCPAHWIPMVFCCLYKNNSIFNIKYY